MKLTTKEIAQQLDGIVVGDEQAIITHPAKIEQATKGAITFLSNPKYESYVYQTQATAILVSENFKPTQAITSTLIKVSDVYSAITKFLQFYENSIHPKQEIASHPMSESLDAQVF